MANYKKLGVFWGEDEVTLVEVHKDAPVASAQVPFSALHAAADKSADATSDLNLLDLLQKTVRNKNFGTTEAYLSLPSREVLVRWFSIPWMKTEEIQGVVAFEVRKYIPFPLEELVYTYYPSTFSKNNTKQIGILLIAIRKDAFERYTRVLTQAGLNVVYSEPSSMSLVRALALRRFINIDHTVAVVNIVKDFGELIITSKGCVKFIRDFKITIPPGGGGAEETELVRAKLFNELRMSLDFFSRQHDGDVSKLVLFSGEFNPSFAVGLSDDMGVPVQIISPGQIISGIEVGGNLVHAFGAALSGSVSNIIDFNLSEGYGGNRQSEANKEAESKKMPAAAIPVLTGLACAGIVGGAWFGTGSVLEQKQREVGILSQRLGSFTDVPVETIEHDKKQEQNKAAALSSLRMRSDIVPLIIRIINLMPEGVWFDSVKVSFVDKPAGKRVTQRNFLAEDEVENQKVEYYKLVNVIQVQIYGYAFLSDNNMEIRRINDFVISLRGDKLLSGVFKRINLGNIKREKVKDKHEATAFVVECQ